MRNIETSMFDFIRALKRAVKSNVLRNKPIILHKDLSCLVGVQYWFYTNKAVWSYIPSDIEYEKVFELKISYIDNVKLSECYEVL